VHRYIDSDQSIFIPSLEVPRPVHRAPLVEDLPGYDLKPDPLAGRPSGPVN
jgi:hypothetical protein